uniref:DegT/DnrJ/EryC1/StrS family aminotransferase n=1 Tax=Desulfomonile tiedjei TaxID=2358 RepID=A0A7C4EUB1_9BACT
MPGHEWIDEHETNQVLEVMKTGILFRYEFKNERKGVYKVKEFEDAFAAFNGAKYAHAVTSGTAALKVALAALGIGPGDEVITQGFTFIATFEAIIEAGAAPVPAEIDLTLNMDPSDFEKKITSRTKAVIPVHMLGAPARIEEIVAIAKTRGLKVIEDTAQALGAEVNGRKVGTIGDMGTFSFDFYKTITTGEGGMILTNDKKLYDRASEYADHGHDHNPAVGRAMEGRNFLGFNYRMHELTGAIGLAQISKLNKILERQRQNAGVIVNALQNLSQVQMRSLPAHSTDSCTHVCFFLPDAQTALEYHKKFTEKGFAAIYFRNNLWHYLGNWEHLLAKKTAWPGPFPFAGPPYGGAMEYHADMLPQTKKVLEKTVVIPVALNMSAEHLGRLTDAIVEVGRLVGV